MFYQLNWQQMEKNWKVTHVASFYFTVTHYGTRCLLISVSSSFALRGEEGGSCNASAFAVCFLGIQLGGVSPGKRAVPAECPFFHQHFNAKI